MKQRRRRNGCSSSNTISLLLLFFLVFFSRTSTSTSCRRRTVKHLSTTSTSSTPLESRITSKVIVISIVSGILTGLVSALVLAFLVRSIVKFMKQTPILKGPVVFSPKITPKSLHAALSNVKRLGSLEGVGSPESSSSKSVKRRLQKELELLAGLRHRNLMSLRAYVRESDEFSLVYDYMPNGSLEDVMNKVRTKEVELGWEIRLRVAVGIVKGLQYLHFSCETQILHYNLKPTNVMLDSEFEPRLADCGLAKIMPSSHTAVSCYSAPESSQSNRYTDKSDIFSFGMILGVLLTGRDPTHPFCEESASGGSLGQWLKHLQQSGEAREALDKTILGEEVEEDEMLMALRITIICLSDFPADRPSSDELVHMLTQLHSF
ncbi:Protein kinase superfamily protein [Arabidopsis thaliana]|uniref:Isoform 2 of Inactive leucine-rich repeat receptor-like protein kinase CORYNE n=1 Tax=Arabidopsis thaliana TaxID=3702 RepID=Q9LYU7-2|nr:Protein kinase superfamily protein [Arabidopsis thaliana]AED91875.1 Protein kinase superfamily protein [Arabidopsis thaliana]|eukprot:NP_196833.2 Protein kinase superfamily protein [Arabidopsis thaliana]